MKCPECGKRHLIKFGKVWRKVKGQRVKLQRYQCNDCGKMWQGRK